MQRGSNLFLPSAYFQPLYALLHSCELSNLKQKAAGGSEGVLEGELGRCCLLLCCQELQRCFPSAAVCGVEPGEIPARAAQG